MNDQQALRQFVPERPELHHYDTLAENWIGSSRQRSSIAP